MRFEKLGMRDMASPVLCVEDGYTENFVRPQRRVTVYLGSTDEEGYETAESGTYLGFFSCELKKKRGGMRI